MTAVNCITKPCIKCNLEKPLTDFYTHPGTKDGRLNVCKVCFRAIQKTQKTHPKDEAVNDGERLAIEKLKSVGIDAIPGKMSEWKHQDVVAANTIRVEVKYVQIKTDGSYLFKFDSQVRNGMLSQVIILITNDGIEPAYHVFPSDHPVFFGKTGERKKGLTYKPFAKHRKLDAAYTLTPAIMLAHRDNWQLIEELQHQHEQKAA